MARTSLTKRTVDAAKPTAVEYVVWDDEVSGFGVKVAPSGSKVYFYRYRISRPGQAARTAPSKYTIGKHGNLTPDQARKRAKDLAALVAQGIDPRKQELETFAAMDNAKRSAVEKARLESELAFDSFAEKWLVEYALDHRPTSVAQGKRVIDLYLAPRLANKPLPHIGRADLQPIIDAISPTMRATRQTVFAYASILFGWAHKRGDIAENPLTSMAKPRGCDARDRVLADDELASIWTASANLRDAFGGFVRLLILTGQRREEVAAMTWGELDRAKAEWIIPANRAKNGSAHIVPLSPAVVAELDRMAEWKDNRDDVTDRDAKHWPKAGPVLTTNGIVPIRGFSKAKAALDAEITKARDNKAMAAWRIHDLRRTLATGFQRLGIRFEVTEATLNHVSGAKGGVAGIYQKHDWKEEKRAALEAWARHVKGIVTPAATNNVVSLRMGQKPS